MTLNMNYRRWTVVSAVLVGSVSWVNILRDAEAAKFKAQLGAAS